MTRYLYLFLIASLMFLSLSFVFQPSIEASASQTAVIRSDYFVQPDFVSMNVKQCPLSADQLHTMHLKYYKDINIRMLVIGNEPLGYEGGLFALGKCLP